MENLSQSVQTLFTSMENFTQKEGLIGKPVTHSDKTFLPVVSLSLGYGGGDTQAKNQQGTQPQQNAASMPKGMNGGALGLGAKLCADAVLVIDKGNVFVAPVGSQSNMSQIIEKVPQIVSNMTSAGGQQQQPQPQNKQQ